MVSLVLGQDWRLVSSTAMNTAQFTRSASDCPVGTRPPTAARGFRIQPDDDQIDRQTLRVRDDLVQRVAVGQISGRGNTLRPQPFNGFIEQFAIVALAIDHACVPRCAGQHGPGPAHR